MSFLFTNGQFRNYRLEGKKEKVLTKFGVPPPTITSEAPRSDTGALPGGGTRMEEV
jgi:hypothetical protein